jgi:hypothetical protein
MTAATLPPLLAIARGSKVRLRRARVQAPKEIKLHVHVADLLRDHCLPEWRWTHINRKAANAREGAILKKMGANRGWPDFILVSPYGSIRCLELKRLGEETSGDQEEFRLWCSQCGIPHVVAWTMDQVHEAFMNWRCLRIEITKRVSG